MSPCWKRLAGAAAVAICTLSITPAPAVEADNAPAAPLAARTSTPEATWASLFDDKIPLDARKATLEGLEQQAGSADSRDLYLLGSLYHMGQHAHGSPVDANAEKAGIYFANAAVRGSALAMAKMAEIKFTAHQYREAMNWAQIYVYYAVRLPKKDEVEESYAAALVKRIQDNVERWDMDAIMKDVRSFIVANDERIRAGLEAEAMRDSPVPSNRHRYVDVEPGKRGPDAGMADFLVAFRPDGTAASVQLIDAVPRMDSADVLRPFAYSMVMPPASASEGTALRYAWVPAILGDGRYAVRDRN